MPASTKSRRSSQSKRAELERRLKEIRSQETTIKERIYKLEASIAGAPGMESARRLRLWNTVPAEEAPVSPRSRASTRYQRRLVNRGRSRQALAALFLMGIALLLGIWLTWQMKTYGVM
jgi:hypothetical protein